MKTSVLPIAAIAALAIAFAGSPADAQRKRKPKPKQRVAGDYEVKFEEVGNSCGDRGIGFSRGRIKLKRVRGRRMSLTIPLIPLLTGVVSRDGKFRARAKLGSTNTAGMQGRFAANGRVDDGVIQLVLIAEYFTKKRPLCTQSWNVTGVRKGTLSRTRIVAPVLAPAEHGGQRIAPYQRVAPGAARL